MSQATRPQFQILIVDDEFPLRVGFKMVLNAPRFLCRVAGSGLEALEKLKNHSFDLVLLDLRMPRMSGLEVLEMMRDRGDDTKVVVLSAYIPGSAVIRAAASGVTCFIGKPVAPVFLREQVRASLNRGELADGFRERAFDAASRRDFARASGLLGRCRDLSEVDGLWLEIFRRLSAGERLHDLADLAAKAGLLVHQGRSPVLAGASREDPGRVEKDID